jgi:TIR domain
VFISYSWDSPEHRVWVAQLGGYLRQNGIDVLLDQWHVGYGEDLARFMERAVQESDRVLVICTANYVEKAAGRKGGVGYELTMVTSELIGNADTAKFIPIVVQNSPVPKLPAVLATRRYFDHFKWPSK